MTDAKLSVRIDPNNPNHHLYSNNGIWWIHYTLHLPNYTSKRVRHSLRTRHLPPARHRRDQELAKYEEACPAG